MRALLGVLIVLLARPAYAFRPFNSTDASVAERGNVEIECGPMEYIVDADGRFLVVPAIRLNVGVAYRSDGRVIARALGRADAQAQRSGIRALAVRRQGLYTTRLSLSGKRRRDDSESRRSGSGWHRRDCDFGLRQGCRKTTAQADQLNHAGLTNGAN